MVSREGTDQTDVSFEKSSVTAVSGTDWWMAKGCRHEGRRLRSTGAWAWSSEGRSVLR